MTLNPIKNMLNANQDLELSKRIHSNLGETSKTQRHILSTLELLFSTLLFKRDSNLDKLHGPDPNKPNKQPIQSFGPLSSKA